MSRDELRVDVGPSTRAPARDDALRVVAPALVGRAGELDLLLSMLSAPPAVAVIEGEAGVGKTRLVAELAAHPDIRGRRFVVGGCRRIREPFPLGPVIEAVRGLGDQVADATLSPVAGALRPLLPELTDWLPPQPPPLDDSAAQRHRVFRGLVDVLASVGPAVLVMEDLHWTDEQTPEFISYLLEEAPQALSVVLTYRPAEAAPSVRAVTAKLPPSVASVHVSLEPLDVHHTGAMAAAILQTDRVSEQFAAYLRERTAGLPFAIEEVLALLRQRCDLVHDSGGWARRALDELHVPVSIRDSVLERVSHLSHGARAVVEAAAVLQRPVPPSVLTTTSRAATPTALRGVEEALACGVLVEHEAAVGFRHVLAAQAVYDDLTGPRRQDLHGHAVRALQALDPVPLGQVAHHLRQVGVSAAWAVAAERAADEAVEHGNDAEAVRLYEDVLRHAPDAAVQPGRLAVKLARSANELLCLPAGIIELLTAVQQQELPQVFRGEVRLRLAGLVARTRGDLDVRRRLLVDAVDDLDDRPDLKAWAMMALGIPRPPIALSEHVRWLRRSLATLPDVADADFRVFLLGKVAMILVAIGDPDWRTLTERMDDQTEGLPRTRRAIEAYASVGMAACYAGHHEIAGRLLGAALEGAAACESPKQALHIRSALALLDYCRGAWEGLAARATPLLDELAEMAPARTDVHVAAGGVALAHGDVDRARLHLSEVVADGSQETLTFAVSGIARLCLVEGNADEALTHVDRLLSGLELQGWASIVRALPACVQSLVSVGRQAEALALVEGCEQGVTDLDLPLAPAALRHARGFLAPAEQHGSCAAGDFLAAAESYEALHCPYEAAQAREQAALSLLAAGRAQAEGVLSAALASYQGLGATWDAARCARAARAHGVRVPTPHRGGRRGYGTALSPRERQVAELASQGRTNKGIAGELFLSPNTVSKHLVGAMRKLGVTSRAALATRLAGASDNHAAQ